MVKWIGRQTISIASATAAYFAGAYLMESDVHIASYMLGVFVTAVVVIVRDVMGKTDGKA